MPKSNRGSWFALLAVAVTCAAPPTQPSPAAVDVEGQRTWLREFGAKYHYDTGYLQQLLELSPAAYGSFAAGMGMAERLQALPADAYFVGIVSALQADSCGACTQLNLRLAVEAGVDRAVLRQLLTDPAGLPPTLRLVHDYATQVVRGANATPAQVEQLQAAFGKQGFAELAVHVLGCRIYPGLRRAMGAEAVCPAPNLDF